MSHPASDVFSSPLQADSLLRADALEREITDLCAQINAACCNSSPNSMTRAHGAPGDFSPARTG